MLLNGWGVSAHAWQSIIPFLQQWSDVVVIDVVYESDVDVLCEKLSETLYENPDQDLSKPCILMGWSLGGMLATRIAAMYPQSVSGLITLASNAQFVASDDWPTAMAEEVFAGFHQSYKDNAEKALQRFSNLVVQGDLHRREQKRYLQSLLTAKQTAPKIPAPQVPTLQQLTHYLSGLELLRDINNQTALQKINCPALHCFGENDALLPVQAVEKIKNLNGYHQCEVIGQAGHLLHAPPERLELLLNHFFAECIV
ncbi:MAG: pimeloyl-ACP methyl ester esterase [Granulosicoccus sp.]